MVAASPIERTEREALGPNLWFDRLAWVGLVLVCLAAFLPGQTKLPPFDRDESRFAQASKQMIESGDWVDIRFQDEPRHNKPVGIYWLQASAASLLGGAAAPIGAYRVPSLLGATAAVLLTFWAGLALVGRRPAALAAVMLATCVLLPVEARLAKTDAMLLACCVLAQGALARLWLAADSGRRRHAALFWLAQGAGILIKGPILPMISALTMAALLIVERSPAKLARLRAGWGLPLMLLIVLPWLVAIGIATHGAFFAESLGRDLFAKVGSGQESHGAPPGTYLVAFWLTFFPWTLLAATAAPAIWRRRREPAIRFLLAWLIPSWLVFEIVATKLLHYVLPVYPALALLAAAGIVAARPLRGVWRVLAFAAWVLPALVLPAAAVALPILLDGAWNPLATVVATLAAGLFVVAAAMAWRARLIQFGAWSLAGQLVLLATVLGVVLPDLHAAWPSRALTAIVREQVACMDPRIAVAGYSEPSLVFSLGTGLVITDGAGAAAALEDAGPVVAIVEARHRDAFRAELGGSESTVRTIGRTRGWALNRGRNLDFEIFANPAATCAAVDLDSPPAQD